MNGRDRATPPGASDSGVGPSRPAGLPPAPVARSASECVVLTAVVAVGVMKMRALRAVP